MTIDLRSAVPVAAAYAGTGFVHDTKSFPPQTEDDLFAGHPSYAGAVAGAGPATFDSTEAVISHIGGIRSQGQSPSCVPWAFAQALAAALFGQGLGAIVPSPALAYLGGLLETAREAGLPPVLTAMTGLAPTAVVTALGRMGLGLESFRPFPQDPATLNDAAALQRLLLAPETIAQAGDASGRVPITITAYAQIAAAAGAARLAAVKQIIAAFTGSWIPAALATDAAFNAADGSTLLLAPDPATYTGGHMITLSGYSTVVATDGPEATLDFIVPATGKNLVIDDPTQSLNVGDLCARVTNQWGTDWAPRSDIPGTAWGGPAFINALAWLYAINAKLGLAIPGRIV